MDAGVVAALEFQQSVKQRLKQLATAQRFSPSGRNRVDAIAYACAAIAGPVLSMRLLVAWAYYADRHRTVALAG